MDPVIGGAHPKSVQDQPIRALVIDDDPSIVRFLEIYLGGHGFEIRSALTGQEGLEMATADVPDILLLDYLLPDIDGGQVLHHLKEREETRRLPVVVFTSQSSVAEKVKSLGLGVDDYIAKPFDIRELEARLRSILARRTEQQRDTEAAKMRTVRELVASVSHEVNNPLAAILMCAETLERRHAALPDVVGKSRVIQENTMRIRDILKRLESVKALASKPYVSGESILDLTEPEEEQG
jgi:DNA-binding response OmpR family regulator